MCSSKGVMLQSTKLAELKCCSFNSTAQAMELCYKIDVSVSFLLNKHAFGHLENNVRTELLHNG